MKKLKTPMDRQFTEIDRAAMPISALFALPLALVFDGVPAPGLSRREALIALPAIATLPQVARAAEIPPTSNAVLPQSLLSIVEETLSSDPDALMRPLSLVQRPAYGIETSDVFYPDWFLGRWSVRSALRQVLLCCEPVLLPSLLPLYRVIHLPLM